MRIPQPDIPFNIAPMVHQRAYLDAAWGQPFFGNGSDMGTGKTFCDINEAARQFAAGMIDSYIISAEKGIYLNWVDQLVEHMPYAIPYQISIRAASGEGKIVRRIQKRHPGLNVGPAESFFQKPAGSLAILLINTESLSSERGAAFLERALLAYPWVHETIDESTTIKHHTSARGKVAIKTGRLAAFRRIQSGSWADNSPLDVYGQLDFLDPSILGFRSFTSFKRRYCQIEQSYGRGQHYDKIIGFQHLDELAELTTPYMFVVKKEDCLDLPPKVYETRHVTMNPEQTVLYKQMKKDCLAVLDSIDQADVSEADVAEFEKSFDSGEPSAPLSKQRTSTAQIVLTQVMRLQQIACGFLHNDAGEDIPIGTSNPRLEELLAIASQCTGKMIIWSTYRHDIQTITAALKQVYGDQAAAAYFGDTSIDDREIARIDFEANPVLRFFVGNPSTGGRGLTLNQAGTVVYFSNRSGHAEMRNQSEDRCHRIGQTKSVLYIDLVVPGTVDETILDALRGKKRLSEVLSRSNWRQMFGDGEE